MEKFDQVVSVWGPNPLCERGYGFQINSNETGSKLVYGSEKNLVVRDYDNPENCTVYSDHRGEVTVAKFSHKGDYIASADKLGSIHLLKVKGDQLEFEKTFMGIGGRVYDLCWYSNDKGLAVAGDAKGTNGRVFTLSGTDQGAIQAPKRLTSVDMSPVGQVTKGHLVTGSDDNRARTYHYDGGFKSSEVSIPHENACNMVRFSPNGELIASVGGKTLIVNKVSEGYSLLKQMAGHNGTVYGCGWNTDGTRVLTCSADKTVKLWDVETGKCLSSFDMKGTSGYVKNDAVDFQVGCCFAGERPVSLSLSGDINYLDDSSGKVGRIIRGPAGSLTGVSVHKDGLVGVSTQGEVLLYSSEGHVSRAKGLTEPKTGVGCVSAGDVLYSTSFDDRVSEVKVSGEELVLSNGGFNLEHQPVYIRKAYGGEQFVVVTTSEVYILKDVKKPNGTLRLPSGSVATCACLSPDGTLLAVGLKSNEVKFYFVSNGGSTIADSGQSFGKFPHEPISISFSPKGDQCAIGLKTKFVKVCSLMKSGNSLKIVDFCSDNWCRNSSSIFDVDYSPDGTKLMSCGGEGGIVIYNALDGESFDPLYHFKLAHKSGVIQTKWIDDNSFYSVGRFDGTVKKWKVA